MPLHDPRRAEGDARCRNGSHERPFGIGEGALVMRIGLAQRIGDGPSLAASPGSTGALQIVGRMWRQVVHHHGRDAADIHAHLHGGGAVQHVDIAALEILDIFIQPFCRLLRRVFCGSVVEATLDRAVADIRPQALLAQLGNDGLSCDQLTDLYLLGYRGAVQHQCTQGGKLDLLAAVVLAQQFLRQIGCQTTESGIENAPGQGADPALVGQREGEGF
ncbi:hypothetical protein D3C77_430980 [compost metagenome]